MKKFLTLALSLIAFLALITSCDKFTSSSDWSSERDSLMKVNKQQQELLDNMNAAMAEIAYALDTIASHERVIVSGVDEEGNRLSRTAIKDRLDILANVIREQRERLGQLEEILSANHQQIAKLQRIIEFLDNSLTQKDQEVAQLKKDLDNANFNMSQLEQRVSHMSDTISSVRATNAAQNQQIAQQDAQLNEVYYAIGTDDDLLAKGLLKKEGRVFKSKKIDFANLDKSVMTKGDIRYLSSISISGKSPKILSSVPDGSYKLEKQSNDSYILYITNPDSFWSANNRILIIQVKK